MAKKTKKGLGTGVTRTSTPLKKSGRKTITASRVIKKNITYNGPTATCVQVESCVVGNSTIETWITNLINGNTNITDINSDLLALENRVTSLENAGYITCATLSTCSDFSSLVSRVTALENLNTPYYQTVETIGGGIYAQRDGLAFGPGFIITDNATDDTTEITLDPAYIGGSGGSSTDTNDYVSGGSYDDTTKLLTLSRTGTSGLPAINIDMSALSVSTQMSIDSDSSGIKLVNDVVNPGNNMFYGTDGAGIRGRYVNTNDAQLSYNATSATTVNCPHNLGRFPSVLCIDSSGDMVHPGNVNYPDDNNITVTFSPAFTGIVYLT